jgi:mRNA interferase RelE/StbE
MAAYNVTLKPSVEKDLRALHPTIRVRVLERIAHLREEAFPRQAVKLAGGEQWYRLRVGDYRIVYGVDRNAMQVTVHYVRHRRDVYRGL